MMWRTPVRRTLGGIWLRGCVHRRIPGAAPWGCGGGGRVSAMSHVHLQCHHQAALGHPQAGFEQLLGQGHIRILFKFKTHAH